MALAGWAIERVMAAVPLSRIAERRLIAPERLQDDVARGPRKYVSRMSPLASSGTEPVNNANPPEYE
jgi:hypothetical protein